MRLDGRIFNQLTAGPLDELVYMCLYLLPRHAAVTARTHPIPLSVPFLVCSN